MANPAMAFTDPATKAPVEPVEVENRVRKAIDVLLTVALRHAQGFSTKNRRSRLEQRLLMGAYDALAGQASLICRFTDPDLYEVDGADCVREDNKN